MLARKPAPKLKCLKEIVSGSGQVIRSKHEKTSSRQVMKRFTRLNLKKGGALFSKISI